MLKLLNKNVEDCPALLYWATCNNNIRTAISQPVIYCRSTRVKYLLFDELNPTNLKWGILAGL